MQTIKLLARLVQLNSVFPYEKKLSEFLFRYLTGLGFIVQKVYTTTGRDNLIATYGESEKYLGFYGHMDTVPPDKSYKRNPFTIFTNADRIYGLGTADMKGGITAILKLAEFASHQNLPVKLIFGVDEENISLGAHDLVNSKKLNDIKFLIVAESGRTTNLKQKFNVCYGRRGRIAFRAKVFGKSAHAAEGSKGINAIEQAALLLANITKISFPKDLRLGTTNLVVHMINGSSNSFSVPDFCEFEFSALTTPPIKAVDILKNINKLANKLNISIKVEQIKRATPYAESYEVDLSNKFLKKIETNIFNSKHVKPIYTESVADENIFANRLRIPVITIGPIGSGDHTANEWVSLKSIDDVIQAYQEILSLYIKMK